MIGAKKLIKLARKWQKLAAIRRKRISWPQSNTSQDENICSISAAAEKGHFVVYSIDQKRFVLPLNYLNDDIVRELFHLAEEEYGLSSDGPLTLPCDSAFIEYVITLIRKGRNKSVEKALLASISGSLCLSSSSIHPELTKHQIPICSF